jgi:hypothetical protein
MPAALGRNDPCHCGSGRKYKQCHLGQDEAAAREARAQSGAASAEAEAPAAEPERAAGAARQTRAKAHQPWKRSGQNTRGFQKHSAPRKVGGS